MRNIEVQQKANPNSAQLQIRKELSLVNRQYLLDGFDFDENALFNSEIHTISGINLETVVHNRERELRLERKAGSRKFMRETAVVHALETACTDMRVYFESTSEDLSRDLIHFEHSLYSLRFLCGEGRSSAEDRGSR
jgi:hypothetical protein